MESLSLLSATATTLLAFVFTQAAWHKLADATAFSGYLADYRLLPDTLVRPVALFLIGAEVLIVVGLLTPSLHVFGALGALALLCLYAAAMGVNLLRGRSGVECGCGGAVQPISPALLVRNALLALAAAMTALYPVSGLGFGAAVVGLATGFLSWVLLGAAEQIVANSTLAHRLKQL